MKKITAPMLLLALLYAGSGKAQETPILSEIQVLRVTMLDLQTIRLDLSRELKTDRATARIRLFEADLDEIPVGLEFPEGASGPNFFSEVKVHPRSGEFNPSESYLIEVQELQDDTAGVGPKTLAVGKLVGAVSLNVHQPNRINLIFSSPLVRMSSNPQDVEVKVKRKGVIQTLKVERVEAGTNQNMVIWLAAGDWLLHGDDVSVSTVLQGTSRKVMSTAKFNAAKPKDKASSTVFLAMNAEAGKGQDFAVGLDLKISDPFLVKLREGGSLDKGFYSWTLGPVMEAEISSTDKNDTNRFSYFLNWRRLGLRTPSDKRWISTVIDVGPKLEFDTGFNNRNAVAAFTTDFVLLGADLKCPFGSKDNKDCWIAFRPTVGAEAGTNFGIEGDHPDIEDYSIARGVGGFYFSWTRKFQESNLNAISFSIDGRARYLFEEEGDFEDNPGGRMNPDGSTATLIKNDGLKAFGKATLSFAISENFAIVAEYSRGERPPVFKDEDKVKASFAFAF